MVSFSRRGRRWPQGGAGAGGAGSVTVPRGQLILTGFAPQGLLTQPRSGELQLVGHAPIPQMSKVTAGLGQLALSGHAPSVIYRITPGVGQLQLAGFAPNISDVLIPGPAQLVLSGPAPIADNGQLAAPGVGQLTLTGHAPVVESAELTSLSEFGKSASSTESLTLPANIAAGDVILFLNRSSGFAETGSSVPSGFTSIDIQAPTITQAQQLSYKIAAGNEGGTNINGLVGTGNDFRNACIVVRGNVPITAVNVVDVDGEETAGAPTAQTITSGSGSPPLIVVGAFGASSTITDESFSTTEDSDSRTTDERLILMTKYYDSSPANSIVDMGDNGSFNCLQSCYIECS